MINSQPQSQVEEEKPKDLLPTSQTIRKSLVGEFNETDELQGHHLHHTDLDELHFYSQENNNKEFRDFFANFSQTTKPVPTANPNPAPSILSSQVHQILYSKPMNFIDADSDFDENEEIHQQDSNFYNFEEPDLNNKEDCKMEANEDEDEQYIPTDYSDNSSSNQDSYYYHEIEEDEIINEENQPPKMFDLFDSIQFNTQKPEKENISQNTQQKPPENLAPKEKKFFGGGVFSGLVSQFWNNNNKGGFSNSQPTLFPKNPSTNQGKSPIPLDNDIDLVKDKGLGAIKVSPIKSKRKRLYCNEKKIPLWATDLKEVEKIAKEQQKMFNPTYIFGVFNEENLNLVEVFQRREFRFLKPR